MKNGLVFECFYTKTSELKMFVVKTCFECGIGFKMVRYSNVRRSDHYCITLKTTFENVFMSVDLLEAKVSKHCYINLNPITKKSRNSFDEKIK